LLRPEGGSSKFLQNVVVNSKLYLVKFKKTFQLYLSFENQSTKMDEACGAYGGGERCAQGSGGET
jgi:hypothetical protein